MNVTDLLKNSPGLVDSIKDVGVPGDKIGDLGGAITRQLGGMGGLDIGSLLGGLDAGSFLSKLDVPALAQQVGLSQDVVQKAVKLIAPQVEKFVPGGLGSLAGKLFG